MRRGMAGEGSSDRAPIAVTQRGEADAKATTSNALRQPQRSEPEGRVCSGVLLAGRYPTLTH
jgi:hypothetical protein